MSLWRALLVTGVALLICAAADMVMGATCGNGVVESGEKCDPPGSPVFAGCNVVLCGADCAEIVVPPCSRSAYPGCGGACPLPSQTCTAGDLGICECAERPRSCAGVLQPPGSCAVDGDCPPGYGCSEGSCRGGACIVKSDCSHDGECVHVRSAPEGVCVCRGCGPQACPLGCTVGGIFTGCRCSSEEDCPPEDDVCFLGVCS